MESRSMIDEERCTVVEAQLKEAQLLAEDADRKYDEVFFRACRSLVETNERYE